MNAKHEPRYRWGVVAIAEKIQRPKRSTYHLLATGKIPGRKVGDTWVAEDSELEAALSGCEE